MIPAPPASEEPTGQQDRPTPLGLAPDGVETLVPGPTHRWGWRRRLHEERPHLERLYRVVVGVVGGLLLLTWLLVSWLPGPGGIPLLLLALALLSTEFRWARRLLVRARAAAHRFTAWAQGFPVGVRVLGSAVVVVAVLVAVGAGLVVWLGVPGWLPEPVAVLALRLPGATAIP